MFVIFRSKPDFVPTENSILHCVHIVRREKKLRSMAVDFSILEHLDDIAQELWMQFCIELVDDDHAAFRERQQEHGQGSDEFLRAVGFFVKGKFVRRCADAPHGVELMALLVESEIRDVDVHVIQRFNQRLFRISSPQK